MQNEKLQALVLGGKLSAATAETGSPSHTRTITAGTGVGTGYRKGSRRCDDDDTDENSTSRPSRVDIHEAALEQQQLQEEAAAVIDAMKGMPQAKDDRTNDDDGCYDIDHCVEYLREERVEEQWDCETILSTYSVLDNHPTMLSIPVRDGVVRP